MYGWGVVESLNFVCSVQSSFDFFHCNVTRKTIKPCMNLHTIQQIEHTPEVPGVSARHCFQEYTLLGRNLPKPPKPPLNRAIYPTPWPSLSTHHPGHTTPCPVDSEIDTFPAKCNVGYTSPLWTDRHL